MGVIFGRKLTEERNPLKSLFKFYFSLNSSVYIVINIIIIIVLAGSVPSRLNQTLDILEREVTSNFIECGEFEVISSLSSRRGSIFLARLTVSSTMTITNFVYPRFILPVILTYR